MALLTDELFKNLCADLGRDVEYSQKSYTLEDDGVDELVDSLIDTINAQGCQADDFKMNMSRTTWSADDIEFYCNCSFILYPEDTPKAKFKKLSTKIEDSIRSNLNSRVVDCVRYDDSEYSSHGYDVSLTFKVDIDLSDSIATL